MTNLVEIRQVGRTVAVPEGVTILDAVLADGVAYPHGCRSGRCGSCKSRLVSGKADLLEHSRFALSDEEKAQGLILALHELVTNALKYGALHHQGGTIEVEWILTPTDRETRLNLTWRERGVPRSQAALERCCPEASACA